MALGEAFIEVHADLRPFARDLRRNVRPIAEAFEREINGAVNQAAGNQTEQAGRRIGERLSRGMKRSLLHQFQSKNAFIAIAGTLGAALDDGISALPTEIKAAIVLGLLAASPLIAGGLTGAIVAGTGAGLAGLGIALASQFEQVQTAGTEFGRNLRTQLVQAAGDFVPAILQAFATIEARIRMLRPVLDQIFNVSSNFVEPLTEGLLGALEEILDSIETTVVDMEPFVQELGSAFQVLGDAIGQAIEILVSTGDDGVTALRDLIYFAGILIVSFAQLLKFLTHVYGFVRKLIIATAEITGGLSIPLMMIAKLFREIDERSNRNKSYVNTNTELGDSFDGLIVATKGETDALKEYQDALENVADAAKSNLELNVRWEESLDRIAESLKENGKNLDIHTEKGRNNVNEFIHGLEIAEQRALLRVQRGEQTAAQAADQYKAEVAQLRELARQAGISEASFNALFDEIITTSALRISASDMGVDALGNSLNESANAAQRLKDMLEIIKHLSVTFGKGALAGVRGFAEGGIASFPQLATVAESGPEVIIPMTKPARAAQLLQQSGLASMLGGGSSQVLVFIGNEQLDSRMVRIVQRGNQAQALALSHGGRTF